MVVKTSIDINLNEHAHIRLCTRGGNLLHSRASAIISRCETFIELKCTNNCTEPLFFFYKTMIVWQIIALKHFWVEKKVNIRSL